MSDKKQLDNAVELADLVYAPLEAVAGANIRLSSNIVDFLANTGDLSTDSTGNAVVKLRTIQMLYEQLRSDSMDNSVADCIGLEIPLLSIYPLSSLKVAKTKVAFGAEIRSMSSTPDGLKIYTQVSSSQQRDGAVQPRISYEVELDSSPVSEGLARFVDLLNTQAIPKRIHSKPLDSSGKKLTGKELEDYERMMELKRTEAELVSQQNEVKELMRIQNNALELETGMNYLEYKEHLEHLQDDDDGKDEQPPEAYFIIEKYQPIIVDLEARLTDVRKQMVSDKVQSLDDDDDSDGDTSSMGGNSGDAFGDLR